MMRFGDIRDLRIPEMDYLEGATKIVLSRASAQKGGQTDQTYDLYFSS